MICTSKEDGGLEVRRVGAINLAMMGKWCWRMLIEKEELWYRVLKARYWEVGGGCRREAIIAHRGGGRCVGFVRG
jgi:hypothetical protein